MLFLTLSGLHLVLRAVITNHHKLDGFSHTQRFILEARSWTSRCQQGHALSRGSEKAPLPHLFQRLVFLVILGVPCVVEAGLQFLPLSSHEPLSCRSVSILLSSYEYVHIFRACLNPVWPHFILITSAETQIRAHLIFWKDMNLVCGAGTQCTG